MRPPPGAPLLALEALTAEFTTGDGTLRAVDGVSFEIGRGEVLGIVGESGSGKSATWLAVLGLLPRPAGRVVAGRALLEGRDLVGLGERALREVRGRRIAMIFQDPMTSLTPYLTLGRQLAEVGQLHRGLTRRQALGRAALLLDRVGIVDPAARLRAYPHQLSGGMRQRAMIAMALLGEPDLLVADEPTTALDVTIQAQILDLLLDLRAERGMAIALVTHDLAVVAGTCDRVVVMYAGRVVEEAPTLDLFARPRHPYTAGLLACIPRLRGPARPRLPTIEGTPPRPAPGALEACAFAPRCAQAHGRCREGEPPLVSGGGRRWRCVLVPEVPP